MERMNMSFSITAEDKVRLEALAEALRVPEAEVVHQMLAQDYSSWQQEAIANELGDPDEPV